MKKLSPADLDAQDKLVRQRIELELDKNFLVEAAAGTGKTTSLVNRLVALVATGKCKVEQIVAITFTRKAAAELRERFQGELRRRVLEGDKNALSKQQQERVVEAADRADQAFVGTIHSFCATLLRERPIEFAVDPEFRELEATEDVLLRQQAWQENIADLNAANDPLMVQLQELGIERNQLKSCFDQFIEYRDVELWPCGDEPALDVTALKQETRRYVDHMRTLIPYFPKDRGRDELMNRYETIERASDDRWNRVGKIFELLEHFDRSPGVVQKAWPQIPGIEKPGKVEDTRWKEFRETWVKPAMNYWRRKRYRFVIEFVRRAVAVYEKLKRAGGGLDFQDLLISVTNGLRKHVELRSYFKMRFPYLLVDEFQDTDPVQAEMMLLLTSPEVKQSNWTKCSPTPGSLFLVGDPKQSIYRFRRGDIVTYNRVKDILQSSGGEVLPLVRNFRSRQRLIDWNNQVYRDKFREASVYSPQCEDMLHGRVDSLSSTKRSNTLDGVYRLCLPDAHSDKIDEITATEADSVARFIRHAIDSRMQIHRTQKELNRGLTSQVQASDFMIIPFGKKRLDLFIQALEEYGIPYQVSGGNSLSNNQQLRWLIDCVRAIDDPLNPLPYLSLLRELFGFSDAELFEFHQAQGRFNPTSDIPSELEIQLSARFQKIVSQFRRYRLWMRTLPYAVALNCIAEDLGLLASAAAHAEGDNHSGGFLKAIEWLRHQSWDFDSASDLIQCLHDICEADDVDGCTALSPDSNVVRIMNLHKAKGLEAPIVFLVDTSRRFSGDVRCHIDRLAERPAGYMGITTPKGQYHTLEVATPDRWNDLQQEEQRYLDAEFNRLLYVATTRAAQAMIVSVGKDDSKWSSLYGYLQSAPQLEIPNAPAKLRSGPRDRPLKQELAQLAPGTRWTQALVPSYEVITAKKLGLKGRTRPKREATSGDYGYQWGSALHELLEICHKRPQQDLSPIALQLLGQFGLDSNRLDELVATAQAVVGSVIWQRAQRSSQCFSELPIEIYEPKTEPSAALCRLVRGVIDLIFQEPDGWVIVDYKTDDITEPELAATIKQYSGQLAEYARIWKSTTRQPVKSVGLFFTRLNRLAEFAPEA